MKDLLLYIPLDDFAKAQHEYIPLGPLYMASYLEEAGFEVDVVHGRVEDIKTGYRFYGLSATSSQYNYIKDAYKHIRETSEGSKVVVGGPHFSAPGCVQEAELVGWEHIVVGDGEIALRNILDGKETSRVVWGTPVADLNLVPYPAFDKIDISRYNFPLGEGLNCTSIITSRGCNFKCAFCSSSPTKLRQRSVDSVMGELDILINKYGFNSLMFVDDMVSVGRKRFYNLLDEVEKLNIKWRCYGRTNSITHEGLERMQRAGCVECAPGIESGNQKILDLIGKGTNVQDNIDWCIKCEEVGIKCVPMVIIGLPGESLETIKDTEMFMRKAKPSGFGYNILMPFPDSPIMRDYDYWKQYITVEPYTWDDCVTKSKKILRSFVSTPALSQEKILEEYYRNYNLFAEITGFDPRKRGTRGDEA